MAPEIIKGASYSGAHVDVWSLGVALATMLTGTLPFQGAGDNELKKRILRGTFACPEHVSSEARDLLSQMLAIAPEQRIEINAIKDHPWLKPYADTRRSSNASDPATLPSGDSGGGGVDASPLDDEALGRLTEAGLDAATVERDVRANAYTHEAACYAMVLSSLESARTARASERSAAPPSSAFAFLGLGGSS